MDSEPSNLTWRKATRSQGNGACVEVAAWRKATRSQANGECVEVAAWRRATYSQANGNCVEAGVAEVGQVLVRDTTNRDGGTLSFSASAWRVFAAGVKQL